MSGSITFSYEGYVMSAEQFDRLKQIEKELFGDGRHITPDARRDLANRLNLLVSEVRNQHGFFSQA